MRTIVSPAFFRLLLIRSLQSVLLILVLIIINFLLIHLSPGDPVHILAGQSADENYYAFIRSKFGLDRPLGTQLWIYLSSVITGDLGYSLNYQQPVIQVILERIPATLLLMLTAIFLSTTVGLLLGVEAARRENSFSDRAINTISLLGYSMPSFSIGHLLLIVFALHLSILPAQNMTSAEPLSGLAYVADVLMHLVLPGATLAIIQIAQITRLTRTQMVTVLREPFITTARAKGVPEQRVVYGHALRNALLPLVTILGNDFGALLSGAVLVETVFAWPGLGRLMIDSISTRDYPVLMGIFLMVSISVTVANFLTDIVYTRIDPRIDLPGRYR